MLERKWLDGLNAVLGFWLVIAPWLLAFSGATAPAATAVVLGLATLLGAGWALRQPERRAPEWVNLVIGALLFISPWVFAFAGMAAAAWNHWILGLIIAAVALLGMIPQVTGLRHGPSH